MKARPILFNGEMVRALLYGRKTQTRRIIEPHRADDAFVMVEQRDGSWWPYRSDDGESPSVGGEEIAINCPYGMSGDYVYVRENIQIDTYLDAWYEANSSQNDFGDGACVEAMTERDWVYREPEYKGTIPNIHMPRWASRLTLRITDVRVQRVRDISGSGALWEGIFTGGTNSRMDSDDCIDAFKKLWQSINGPDAWNANPWVWCLTFEVIHQNVDAVLAEAA